MPIPIIDYCVIAVYVAAILGIGIAMRGRQNRVDDYFLGSRSIGWPLVLLSIVATETSTVTFLSIPGVGYSENLTFLQLPLGFMVGRIVVAAWILPAYFAQESVTLYQVLGKSFGPWVQRICSGIFMITRTFADGLRLYLTAVLVHQVTGWNFHVAVAGVGLATIVYTFAGGIRAVIWTDVLQFVIYMLGAAIAAWVLVDRIPGGWSELWSVAAAEDKLTMFDWNSSLANPRYFWAGLIGGAFISAASHGADQMMVQRCFCTRSLFQARLAMVTSGVVVWFQFAVFLLIGIGLFVFYRGQEFEHNDEIFARFVVSELPIGLRGLILAGAFSAAMSTLSSSLNSVSSAMVTDYLRPISKDRWSASTYLNSARWLTVLAGVAQVLVASLTQVAGTQRSVVDAVITIAAFTTGLVLGLVILGRLSKQRLGDHIGIAAILTGGFTVTWVWQFTTIAGPWYALIGCLTTVLAGSVARIEIQPEPE